MKKLLATRISSNQTDAALLIIRLVVGAAFLFHGYGKIQAPFSWMPPESPVPGVFQFFGAISEFGGGLALIIGLLTRLASLGILFTMMGAISLHLFVMHDSFVDTAHKGSSYELAAVYFTIALFFILNGPGKFSLDAKIFGSRS